MKTITLIVLLTGIIQAKNILFRDEYKVISIKGSINKSTADDFVQKVLTYEYKEIYVYIDSPGGSVIAMFDIINTIKMSKVKFTCVAKFAASAAHSIFEMCDNRYLMPNGFLMAHQASIMTGGTLTSVKRLTTALENRIRILNKRIARRAKMDYKEYDALVAKDLWMDQQIAKKYGQVDGIINKISCTRKLAKKKIIIEQVQQGFFGNTVSEWEVSACPLIDKKTRVTEDSK